jgi:hypothetical protein
MDESSTVVSAADEKIDGTATRLCCKTFSPETAAVNITSRQDQLKQYVHRLLVLPPSEISTRRVYYRQRRKGGQNDLMGIPGIDTQDVGGFDQDSSSDPQIPELHEKARLFESHYHLMEPSSKPRRVGYVITVGNVQYASQGDHASALQWVILLQKQGIPAEDVFLWLPTDPNCTVEAPLGWIFGPRLSVPTDYPIGFSRERMEESDISVLLTNFLDIPELTALVWVFLNHGSEAGLWMDQSPMLVRHFKSVFDRAIDHKKEVLVILDACRSGQFAEAVFKVLKCQSVIILTSAPDYCMSTSVILTDDPRLQQLILGPFLIHGSGFTRELHNEIAYRDNDPLLSELPNHLNFGDGGYEARGFEAQCFGSLAGHRRLRDFFGKTVSPDAQVSLSVHELPPVPPDDQPKWSAPTISAMRLVLPLVGRTERLFDDFCMSGVRMDTAPDAQAFVRIELSGPEEVTVPEKGLFNTENPRHCSILEQISARGQPKTENGPSPPRVYAIRIILAIFAEWAANKTENGSFLRINGVPVEPKRQSAPKGRHTWKEISDVFERVNPLNLWEFRISTLLSRIWHAYTADQWAVKLKETCQALSTQVTQG